jgi:endonuclease I
MIHPNYRQSLVALYSRIDNDDGYVTDVYTGNRVKIDERNPIPDSRVMNIEHSFPKSRGCKTDTKCLADLHHLFPVDAYANSKRSNYPYGEVVEVKWEKGGSKLGFDSKNRLVFEPPNNIKGDLSRAVFYVYRVYGFNLTPDEVSVLKKWAKQDPVSAKEVLRNEEIDRFQANRNPFIDKPELLFLINDY